MDSVGEPNGKPGSVILVEFEFRMRYHSLLAILGESPHFEGCHDLSSIAEGTSRREHRGNRNKLGVDIGSKCHWVNVTLSRLSFM